MAGSGGEAKDHGGVLDGVNWAAVGGVEVDKAVLAFRDGELLAFEADHGGRGELAAVAGEPVRGARDEAFLVGAGDPDWWGGRGRLGVDFGFGGVAWAIVGQGFGWRGFALDGSNGLDVGSCGGWRGGGGA